MPHAQPQKNIDSRPMDDFDSVFGEGPSVSDANGYGSFLPPTTSTAGGKSNVLNTKVPSYLVSSHQKGAQMSSTEAKRLIDDILARKPPPISPTLPRLEPDLHSLRSDPLDLDPMSGPVPSALPSQPPPAHSSPRRAKDSPKRSKSASSIAKIPVTPAAGANPRRLDSSSTDSLSTKRPATAKPKPPPQSSATKKDPDSVGGATSNAFGGGSSSSSSAQPFSSASRLREHFQRMEAICAKEQFTDTTDEWKGLIGSFEKLETIESAKVPRSTQLVTACALTLAWVAEHLVDLILKRMQMRVATGAVDPDRILSQIAQITALREQSRQAYLRALHLSKDHPVALPAPYETFSAAHRLHSPHLSEVENVQVYGKCNWPGGHGHNYVLEVTVAGVPDVRSGMLINLAHLKRIIWEEALVHLDHRNIDQDVSFFQERPSTTENVAIYIWHQLVDRIPRPAHLHKVKLVETDKNWVVFKGTI